MFDKGRKERSSKEGRERRKEAEKLREQWRLCPWPSVVLMLVGGWVPSFYPLNRRVMHATPCSELHLLLG